MELWFIILLSISLSLFIKALLSFLQPNEKPALTLPPGPSSIPIISKIQWLFISFSDLESIVRNLCAKHGPIIALRIGPRVSIFSTSRSLAHQALIQDGAVFASRPPAQATGKVLTSNQHSIGSACYGATWRLLRRNLTSEILHSSRVKSYSHARKWVLGILINRLKSRAENNESFVVRDHFQYAMFCLLVLMCFGEKLEQDKIKEIEKVQRRLLASFTGFSILNFWPRLTSLLFRQSWDQFLQLRRDQEAVLVPLIRARTNAKFENSSKDRENKVSKGEHIVSYVDTLIDLELPDEKRKLDEGEMVTLCSEFLDAGTDTTSTALQWIMANLVRYPHIQEKVFMEIEGVVGANEEEIKEDYLQKMPYLKAVILEGLRRHPPGHFLLPHAVTKDAVLDGYVIPKNATVNFMVADMGWDPKVWEDPMEFKPERFLNDGGEAFDITGTREVKMMPFGLGRRMCPGYALAMLHLEYFVANLVWNFKWTAVDGDGVDLSEKQEFTVVMKNPLKSHISPRIKSQNC